MRKLVISTGSGHHARVTKTREIDWRKLVDFLCTTPPEMESKESRGWYCGAEFTPGTDRDGQYHEHGHRHSDCFVARHFITWDFDIVDQWAFDAVVEQLDGMAIAMYTTFSHTEEKPRFRVVLPLSRPASYDEFQAVSRKLGERVGLEMLAAESHVPCQFMFAPARPAGGAHRQHSSHDGKWVDVDAVLAEYADWTNRDSWPRRKQNDRPTDLEEKISPLDKPGPVGDFCRAFSITAAIAKFELPYVPTANPTRWTYTAGSRPEGAIIYDDDSKIHSHHDSDPAHGQNNAFDLVRLHLYRDADSDVGESGPVTERPSFRAMCKLTGSLPEVAAVLVESEFEDLGDQQVPEVKHEDAKPEISAALARAISEVLRNPTSPRWLIRDELERGVLAVMAGPRGSYKSFAVLDWAMRCATSTRMGHPVDQQHPVYVISAEGGDFDRRARAWLQHFRPDLAFEEVPLFVVERRLDLSTKDGIELIRKDCVRLNIRPILFVLDTFSKLSGGLDENENTAVKAFIGRLDNGLKRAETGFDATVVLVCHTGHSDAGRPRGASAIAADTDAEYIVSRSDTDSTISITRERFKSSPELPPLTYAPEVVDLGYTDSDGKPVTSLVLLPAERSESSGRGERPSGSIQRLVYETALEELQGGESLHTQVLQGRARAKLPTDGQRNLANSMQNAVNALIGKKLLYCHNNNMISLHKPRQVSQEDWNDDE